MPLKRGRGRPVTQTVQDDSNDSSRSTSPSARSQKKKVRWEGKPVLTATNTINEVSSEEEESENIEKTCLTTICSHGKVGCAYYDSTKRILSILEDTQDTPHFDVMRMLLEQVNPDTVLTSSHADDSFIEMLHDHMEVADGTFQIRPFKEFVASRGRDRLLSLNHFSRLSEDQTETHLSSDVDSHSSRPNNAYDFMRSRREISGDPTARRWNASIRLSNYTSVESSPLCVQASHFGLLLRINLTIQMASIGALLDYVVRDKALSECDDDGIGGLDIRDIEMISLDQAMQINADALLSLQVFENESHASVHSDKTKEGLSLFSILNGTKTTSGRNLLRTWLLRPSFSLSEIRSRHDTVSCFTQPENILTANMLHTHLRGIKNMPRIMCLLKDGKAGLADWQGLVKFTYHSTMLRDTISELHKGGSVEVIQKLVTVLDIPTFKDIGIKVNDIIDWEESTTHERVCVRPHIDENLDNRKYIYHGIDSVLSSVAEQISETIPPEFTTCLNVVYFPQLGYLICVPMSDEWRGEAGIQPLDGWTFQFSSDANVYFKSQEMNDLDVHIGDLHSTIVDRELEIVQELLEEVLICYGAINSACDVCAELDCLLSFAEASRLYEYQRPEMVDDNIIEIIQGRHPLYERVVDSFVPNDAHLVGGAGIGSDAGYHGNSLMLCTGANACGKSVYLKQVALIQIMAQVGCFVPAESAKLGLVDKIFTRVSTRESVSKVNTALMCWSTAVLSIYNDYVQSAFMIDLAQVSLGLRNCSARSLLILDEFGKGTLSTDGAGLFCGVIRHLLNRGIDCPKVLVATHFHDVFDEELLDPERMPISFRHMQVMFTSSSGAAMESRSFSPSTAGSPSPSDNTCGLRDGKDDTVVGPREKITYLYRVAEGLSLDSHAAQCAEIFGIPRRIVERAQYVTNLLTTHKLSVLLDERMSDDERTDLEDAEAVCRRFLAWDLDSDLDYGEGEVKAKLGELLGNTEEKERSP